LAEKATEYELARRFCSQFPLSPTGCWGFDIEKDHLLKSLNRCVGYGPDLRLNQVELGNQALAR
jgi:hypothetical protein